MLKCTKMEESKHIMDARFSLIKFSNMIHMQEHVTSLDRTS